MNNELVERPPVPVMVERPPAPVVVVNRGIVIADFDGLARFAKCVYESGLAPKVFANAQAVAVAVQLGLELGLSPMQAVQSVAVINGKPGIYGPAALALVEASGLLEDFGEWYEQGGNRLDHLTTFDEDSTAVCLAKRRGRAKPTVRRFSVADAQRAKLWGKKGREGQDTPWVMYPARMLMWRARGFCLADAFPDVLKGIKTVEELRDYPNVIDAPAAPEEQAAAEPEPHEPAQLPPPEAKPSPVHAAMTGAQLFERAREAERAMVVKGYCQVGDLMSHLRWIGQQEGWAPEVALWQREQVIDAYDRMRRWINQRSAGQTQEAAS